MQETPLYIPELNPVQQSITAIDHLVNLCFGQVLSSRGRADDDVDIDACCETVIGPVYRALIRKIDGTELEHAVSAAVDSEGDRELERDLTLPWPREDDAKNRRLDSWMDGLVRAWRTPTFGYTPEQMYAAARVLECALHSACKLSSRAFDAREGDFFIIEAFASPAPGTRSQPRVE